jgi:hypothetical protein
LALTVALHARAELLDYANRLVAYGQSPCHWVLALEDVHVGAADGRRGHAQQRILWADIGNRLVLEDNSPRLYEDGGLSSWASGDFLRIAVGTHGTASNRAIGCNQFIVVGHKNVRRIA